MVSYKIKIFIFILCIIRGADCVGQKAPCYDVGDRNAKEGDKRARSVGGIRINENVQEQQEAFNKGKGKDKGKIEAFSKGKGKVEAFSKGKGKDKGKVEAFSKGKGSKAPYLKTSPFYKARECVRNIRSDFKHVVGDLTDIMKLPLIGLSHKVYWRFEFSEARIYFEMIADYINPENTMSPNAFCSQSGVYPGECMRQLRLVFVFSVGNSSLEVIRWVFRKTIEIDIKKQLDQLVWDIARYAAIYFEHIFQNFTVYTSLIGPEDYCKGIALKVIPDQQNVGSNIVYVGEDSGRDLPPKNSVPTVQSIQTFGYSESAINNIHEEQGSVGNLPPKENIPFVSAFNFFSYPQSNLSKSSVQSGVQNLRQSTFKTDTPTYNPIDFLEKETSSNRRQSSDHYLPSYAIIPPAATSRSDDYFPTHILMSHGGQNRGNLPQNTILHYPSSNPQIDTTNFGGQGSGQYYYPQYTNVSATPTDYSSSYSQRDTSDSGGQGRGGRWLPTKTN